MFDPLNATGMEWACLLLWWSLCSVGLVAIVLEWKYGGNKK